MIPAASGRPVNAFFDKPGFREALLARVAESHDEIRGEDDS